MGKTSKKLVVYLDQNFISNMAKTDIKDRVNPQFKKLFELLHQGFVDEKLLVPKTFFHDIETSFVPHLKDRIKDYQGYLGQTNLKNREEVYNFQLIKASKEFVAPEMNTVSWKNIFRENPDKRVVRLSIGINTNMDEFSYKKNRGIMAEAIDNVRKQILPNGVSFKKQMDSEIEDHANIFMRFKGSIIEKIFLGDREKVTKFVNSDIFKQTPIVDISSQMWAKILIGSSRRPIQNGDATDVDIISAYLPYVDVMATDTFMAGIIRELKLDKKYCVEIFAPKQEDLNRFELFIEEFLSQTKPVNEPIVSIFVLCDEKIKNDSWNFFQRLNGQIKRCESWYGDWVDLFSFDDGNMPKCFHRASNITFPFYGLQDIGVIEITSNMEREDIIDKCKAASKSNKFILIDAYQDFPANFIQDLVQSCKSGREEAFRFPIFNK